MINLDEFIVKKIGRLISKELCIRATVKINDIWDLIYVFFKQSVALVITASQPNYYKKCFALYVLIGIHNKYV